MQLSIGRVEAVPTDRCVAVGDGRAVVVRVGDEVRAFQSHCLHQDSLLAGGVVRNGVLSCPLHFWRYRITDGSLIGSKRSLESFPVEIVDGEAFVLLPDAEPDIPLRQRLLDRARDYDRDAAWRSEQGTV